MIPSTAIMAHPSRRRFVEGYLEPLLPNATVVWDEKNDRWDTGRRSLLEGVGANSSHHLVVQDDAVLCSNFIEGAARALEHVPEDSPASFYIGRSRPHGPAVARAVRRAVLAGRHWLAMKGPLWGPAIAMPTERIEEVVAAGDKSAIPNYDTRMASYLHSVGTDCWYAIPSLVDHRVGEENPSLVPGRGCSPSRTAHAFIGEDHPFEVDWSTTAFRPDRVDDMWYDGPAGKQCSQCSTVSQDLPSAITHAHEHFGSEPSRIAVYSADVRRELELHELWKGLPQDVRGDHSVLNVGDRPWLVLVWEEDDVAGVGSLPAVSVVEAKHWSEFATGLSKTGIRLQIG